MITQIGTKQTNNISKAPYAHTLAHLWVSPYSLRCTALDDPLDLLHWEFASEDECDCEHGDTYIDINCSLNIDDAYKPLFMSEDGNYDMHFDWQFKLLSDSNKLSRSHNMYNGPGPCLKQGIGKSFNTAMQCVGKCGGMDMEFFHHITANTIEYAMQQMDCDTNCFSGSKWVNIKLEEIIHFLGIFLKMSIDKRNGGYKSYFSDELVTDLADNYSVNIDGFTSWAKNVMPLHQFKQIVPSFTQNMVFYSLVTNATNWGTSLTNLKIPLCTPLCQELI